MNKSIKKWKRPPQICQICYLSRTMCYSAKSILTKKLKTAIRYGNDDALVSELIEKLKRLNENHSAYYANAHIHPKLLTQTNEESSEAQLIEWGLIPHWVKDAEQASKISSMTINARSESIFEKPSFRDAAKSKRCLIALDGYYEYMHLNKRKYPFFVQLKHSPIVVAGLWSEWINKETGEVKKTSTIITTEANELLKKVHNTKQRMPVVLDEQGQFDWMDLSKDTNKLFKPFPSSEFKVHATPPILGKNGVGDSEEASSEFEYPELAMIYGELMA